MNELSSFRLGGDQCRSFLQIKADATNATTVRNVKQKGEATKLNDVVNWVSKQTFDGMTDSNKIENIRHNLTYIKEKVEKHNKSWSVLFHFSKRYETKVLDQKLYELNELDNRLRILQDNPLQSQSFLSTPNDSQSEAEALGTAILRLDKTGTMLVVSIKTENEIKHQSFLQTPNTTFAGIKQYVNLDSELEHFTINFVSVDELKKAKFVQVP